MFIELTYHDGRKVMARATSIVFVEAGKPEVGGSTVWFDEASGLGTAGVVEVPEVVVREIKEARDF